MSALDEQMDELVDPPDPAVWEGAMRCEICGHIEVHANHAALPPRQDEPGLRTAAEWLVNIHADSTSIPKGSALWEDLQSLRAALHAAPAEPQPAVEVALSAERYGWHADGDLCLGSECLNIDVATGDHSTDVHSDEWWEGFAEAGRRILPTATEPADGTLDADTLLATLRDCFHEARAGTPEWRDGVRLGLQIAMNEVGYALTPASPAIGET